MKDIINKLSSYNLFNYLVPGVLFAVLIDAMTDYPLLMENLIIGFFVYYFVGLVVSRFGSLVIEPALRRVKFLNFAEYSRFVAATKKDPKIDVLSETNNMYRTFSSLFVLTLLAKLYEVVENTIAGLSHWSPYILVVLLLVMFALAYRKQSGYIVKRINSSMEDPERRRT